MVEEKVGGSVVLHFFRHGEKEKLKPGEVKPDEEIRLTEKGRLQAVERGKEIRGQWKTGVAFGSPRKRSRETAVRVMLASEIASEKINPNASLEEIEETIKKELEEKKLLGKKIVVDKRLDFKENEEMKKAIAEGRFLEHVIEESDKLAIARGDEKTTSYTRLAGNVAEIIKKYVEIAKRFNKIIEKPGRLEEYGDKLERYFGTHFSVLESFVAKVLEKKFGREKAVELGRAIPKGFGETKGIKVEIKPGENIKLEYEANGRKENLEFDEKLLDEIIKERKAFEEKIFHSKKKF